MKTSTDKEVRIAELLEAAAIAPSAALRDKAESRAFALDTGPRKRKGWKLAVIAAFALLVAALFLSPKAYAAMVLSRAGKALDGVETCTLTFRDLRSGNVVLREYFDRGLWRFERPGSEISIYREGKMWTYRPDVNLVSTKAQDSPFAKGFDGFKLSNLLDQMHGSLENVDIEGGGQLNGRDVLRVSILNAPVQEKMILTVDKSTDLPLHMDAQKPIQGGWRTEETVDFSYNMPLPEKLFQPDFPKTAVDEDTAKANLARDFTHVLATLDDGHPNPIQIRQLVMNDRGHIFLAFTGSMGLMSRRLWIEGDNGVEYLRGQLGLGGSISDAFTPTDVFVDRKRIHLQWWIPSRGDAALPKGLAIRTAGSRDVETAKVEVPLSGQRVRSIPRYFPLLSASIKDDLDVRLEEAQKQMGYAMTLIIEDDGKRRRISDNAGVPCFVSSGPGFKHDPDDVAFALKQADIALNLCDQVAARDATGMDSIKAGIQFDRYEILRYLGRTAEAQEALSEAKRMSPESHFEQQEGWTF